MFVIFIVKKVVYFGQESAWLRAERAVFDCQQA
jgi:hypothetical protein